METLTTGGARVDRTDQNPNPPNLGNISFGRDFANYRARMLPERCVALLWVFPSWFLTFSIHKTLENNPELVNNGKIQPSRLDPRPSISESQSEFWWISGISLTCWCSRDHVRAFKSILSSSIEVLSLLNRLIQRKPIPDEFCRSNLLVDHRKSAVGSGSTQATFRTQKPIWTKIRDFYKLVHVRVTMCGIFNWFCLLASRYYHYWTDLNR